jgi:hypothetical protein
MHYKFSLLILLLLIACPATIFSGMSEGNNGKHGAGRIVKEVYRVPCGIKDGEKVWVVDGAAVRREIFGEFLYGGNDQRYPFIPRDEIWIDNAISAEEFRYTLAHELNERNLMAAKGMSYSEAHDSSLELERKMRIDDLSQASDHEKRLPPVSPVDCDGIKEIKSLPDSIRLNGIYRQLLEINEGITVWVVDGAAIRREVYPDFGLSGNDLAYNFIPKNEIWIDGQISAEETGFSLISELSERESMKAGMTYDDAYTKALDKVRRERRKEFRAAHSCRPVLIPGQVTRDYGTGVEK